MISYVSFIVTAGVSGDYRFELKIHQAKEMSEIRLPAAFYKDAVLEFPMFEAQILAPVFPRSENSLLNYHYSEIDGEPYVCFPSSITTEEKLLSVLRVWAVGQVFVLTYEKPMEPLLTESGGMSQFLSWAELRGVKIVEQILGR